MFLPLVFQEALLLPLHMQRPKKTDQARLLYLILAYNDMYFLFSIYHKVGHFQVKERPQRAEIK